MCKSLWLLALAPIFSLLFFAFSLQAPAFDQRGGPSESSPSDRRWICQLAPSVDSADHAITIVDPDLGSIAVYHVDKTTGDIELRSVRKIEWDLALEEYNGCKSSPHPAEVRAMLKRPSR
jgi:hypothetical protein